VASIPVPYLLGEVGEVFGLAGSVGNDVEELRTKASYDCVVYYAACRGVEEAGEGGVVGSEGGGGGGCDGFEEGRSAGTGETMLYPGDIVSVLLAGVWAGRGRAYICPTSNRLAFSRVHL